MSKRTRERWRRADASPAPTRRLHLRGGRGGSAGAHASDVPTPPDAGLAARALANFWNAGDRVELIAAMRALVLDPSKKPRERTAAFRALVMASRAEVSAIKAAIDAETHETVCAELNALRQTLEQTPD